MRFRDSVIWITGASSGIGKKTAKQFHAEGAHIVFSAARGRPEPGRRQMRRARRYGGRATRRDRRVGRFGDDRRNSGTVWSYRHSGEQCRVDAKGADRGDESRRLPPHHGRQFFGPLMPTKADLPSMLNREAGRVVCVTSVAGKYGSTMRSGYQCRQSCCVRILRLASRRDSIFAWRRSVVKGHRHDADRARHCKDECVSQCASW